MAPSNSKSLNRRIKETLSAAISQISGSRPASSRNMYKKVWNSVSAQENDAKMAVSGYIDEETYRTTGEGTLNMLQSLVGIGSEDVVLEIGAGVGRVGAFVAPICKEWIGTDVSENMLAHIRKRLAQFDNVRTVETSGFDLANIASDSVDVVYCTVVFMHLEEWERFNYVREGFRVLRPGGRMLVDNVDLTSDAGWTFFLEHALIPPNKRPAQISKTSTPEELATYFKRAGFVDIGRASGDLWIIAFGKKAAS